MRILLVNKFLYPRGGAETYLLKVGEELAKRNNQIEYFGMYDEKNIVGNSSNKYTTNMDFHANGLKRFTYPFKIIYSFEAKRKMKDVIKKFKPDLIHLNNINFQLTPSIIDVAYKEKVPIVQTVHDYQMVCPNHLLYSQNKICEKCIHGSNWNCTKYKCIHNSRVKSIIGSIEGILYRKVLKNYRKISYFISPSNFLKEKLIEADKETYENKVTAIHNFIELKQINNVEKDNYVLYFGRLSEEKGLDVFLDVCKELPNIHFKIAGTGWLEDMCKEADEKLENVEFVGFKTGKELETLIAKAKFSVYPSVWYENCPLSILESESLGTPVVTGNFGGMKELVENNSTGILVDNMNKEELKKAIEQLYNDKKIKIMEDNCIKKRNEMMSLKEYCNKLMEIYEQVLKEVK